MKGITPVVAIILLLLIVIAMTGFAFMWFTRMTSGVANQTEEQIQQQMTSASKKVSIDSASSMGIWIRNIGTSSISTDEIGVYKDGADAGCTWSGNIAPGQTKDCGANCTSGQKIRATAPGNFDERICT